MNFKCLTLNNFLYGKPIYHSTRRCIALAPLHKLWLAWKMQGVGAVLNCSYHSLLR